MRRPRPRTCRRPAGCRAPASPVRGSHDGTQAIQRGSRRAATRALSTTWAPVLIPLSAWAAVLGDAPWDSVRLHCKKRTRRYAVGPGEGGTMSNLVTRVQNILLTPKTEWPVIAAEAETTSGLYTKYILIVSAVAAIAMFVKASLIGTSTFIGTYRMDVGAGIGYAVTLYVAGLVGVYLWSLIINVLAP